MWHKRFWKANPKTKPKGFGKKGKKEKTTCNSCHPSTTPQPNIHTPCTNQEFRGATGTLPKHAMPPQQLAMGARSHGLWPCSLQDDGWPFSLCEGNVMEDWPWTLQVWDGVMLTMKLSRISLKVTCPSQNPTSLSIAPRHRLRFWSI